MKKNPWITALIMSLVIVVLCLAVADGMIGIEGKVINGSGDSTEYTVAVNDRTGSIVFWASMLLTCTCFTGMIKLRHTIVSIPVYFSSYCILGAIFGSKMNHHFLPHANGGFLDLTIGPDVLWAVGELFLIQSAVFLAFAGIRRILLTKRR